MSWCEVHQREFSRDRDLDGEMLGCCSLCAVALLYAAEEGEQDESAPITREEADAWGAMFEGLGRSAEGVQ